MQQHSLFSSCTHLAAWFSWPEGVSRRMCEGTGKKRERLRRRDDKRRQKCDQKKDAHLETEGARRTTEFRKSLLPHLTTDTVNCVYTQQLYSLNKSTALVNSQTQTEQNSSEVLFTIHQHEPLPQLIKSSLLTADQICVSSPSSFSQSSTRHVCSHLPVIFQFTHSPTFKMPERTQLNISVYRVWCHT